MGRLQQICFVFCAVSFKQNLRTPSIAFYAVSWSLVILNAIEQLPFRSFHAPLRFANPFLSICEKFELTVRVVFFCYYLL